MKRKIGVLVFMLLAGSVLFAGAQSESPAEVTTSEGPQYGGTLTLVATSLSSIEPPGWDIHESPSISAAFYLSPVEEFLFTGDVLNKGPRGTGQANFDMYQAELPADLVTGNLCESYEVSDDGLVATLHVREGIMWAGNETIGMDPRPYTAEDVAYCINRYRTSAKASKLSDFTNVNPATVVDEYTVQLSFTKPFASWLFLIGYALYCNNYPQEMVEAGADNWRHVTGTGPFELENYVTASQVVYTKNDNWWNKGQVIDGAEYEVPFIDTLVYPLMPDEGTRISALIAGKVDIMEGVSMFYQDLLERSCPELQIQTSPSGNALNLEFNTVNSDACADLEFRRALMLGTNQQEIADAIPGSKVGGFPFSESLGESVYTPIDEMPEEVARLFSYDPEAARQRIEELGYAGATVNINYMSGLQNYVTAAEILADQWTRIGVRPVLNVIDSAVYAGYHTGDGSGWSGVIICVGANSKTSRGIENERSKRFLSVSRDEYFNARMDAMMAEPDAAKRDAMLKEDAIYFIGQVDEIALVETQELTCWWPWVKNYYGETEVGCANYGPMLATLWIDQDLKKSMGY